VAANQFGNLFCLSTFGESHGPALGALIDGCPAGVPWDEDLLICELSRRRPGQAAWTSARNEADIVEVLSGVFEGKTLGSPIAMMVRNQDAHSSDYKNMPDRPGHADDVWREKFGHTDPRGGGRTSGRETVARVMGGAVAQMLVKQLAPEVRVVAFSRNIGPVEMTSADLAAATKDLLHNSYFADGFAARMPHAEKSVKVAELLARAKEEGQSYGGTAEIWLEGVPRGLGQPVFHKLKSDLAAAVMSLGATSAIGLGDGDSAAQQEGTAFHQSLISPVYGGIRGGISTGERIRLEVSFKPTSSVLDVAKKGRHDPCIVPRALPVLEAMMWLVLADHMLWRRLDQGTPL